MCGNRLRNGLLELVVGAVALASGIGAAVGGAGIGAVRLLVTGGLLLVALGAGRLVWHRLYG